MQRHSNKYLLIAQLCVVFLLTVIPSCNCFEQVPPQGMVVSSVLVNPKEYTSDGGLYDLFLQTVPGNKTTRLTDNQANPGLKLGGAIRNPLFSHNGKRIIFLADYSDSDDRRTTMTGSATYPNTFLNVWEVQLDTQKVSPITKGDWGWRIIGWSTDDRYICAIYQTKQGFLDQDTQIPEDIYVWDMQTRQGRRLVRVSDMVRDAFWSHDGKSILYQSWSNAALYSIPLQGGKPKVLLNGKNGRYGYRFSPDGKKVAYVDIDTVYVANADSSNPKPIIKMIRDEHSPYSPKPQWSRDGKKIAMAVYEQLKNGQVSTKLYVYDENTGKDRVVATLQKSVSDPMWSRDGQWFIVKMSDTGGPEQPDPKTGWHTFQREGILAISVDEGKVVTLKEPNEETKGLDWFEISN